MRSDDDDAPRGPRCVLCRDAGWIVVPHPQCVYRGTLVCRRGSKGIATCGVACTNQIYDGGSHPQQCPIGAACAAAGSLTWDQYTVRIGGHDGVAMLADYLEQKAAAARGGNPRGWGLEAYPELVARAGLVSC